MGRWFLTSWVVVFLVAAMVTLGMGYQITTFKFGPHLYVFSEPTVDIEKFKGHMSPVIVEDEWALTFWEGSDPTQDQWVMIGTIFERRGPHGSIVFVQVSTGVTSGVSEKMTSTTFVDLQFIDTGTPSYKLTKVENFKNFDKLLDLMRSKYAKKFSL